jgi:2-oxoglutarate ferredoxin oxidoreductase subunit beta
MAIAAGGSFVARAFAGDVAHLSWLIKRGIRHHGFALIDILQPCVSFNRKNTLQWYRERVYKIDEEKGYRPGDKNQALEKAQEWGEHIPIGIIYEQKRPVFEDKLPALQKGSLVKQRLGTAGVKTLIKEFG